MSASAHFLNPSAAARRLGVSAKALRLYEQHGLITPSRSAAGWRVYGPDEMAHTDGSGISVNLASTRVRALLEATLAHEDPTAFGALVDLVLH